VYGFLNLDKPAGLTSHDCVARVRRSLRTKRVGHGGTLDPAATGVLPIAVGKATRLLQYLPGGKAYTATVRFGVRTATDDLEGEVLEVKSAAQLDLTKIKATLPEFLGQIQQIPPAYSAIQVQGKRLYELARAGQAVEVPVRTVEVSTIELLDWRPGEAAEVDLAIACGAGTYIRAIARDLGDRLGTGATLAQLRRTYSAGFDLEHSLTLETLEQQAQNGSVTLISVEAALQHLPRLTLEAEDARRWQLGQQVLLAEGDSRPEHEMIQVWAEDGLFMGIGQPRAAHDRLQLVPQIVFTAAD
jgi:tRNA pseudouridine55 synthase